ncbi:MAG: protein kinase, partial [Candidatus Melainabacteria bacterium]|nr:protein kinase [Candidatus Melainabacteria bacterium]
MAAGREKQPLHKEKQSAKRRIKISICLTGYKNCRLKGRTMEQDKTQNLQKNIHQTSLHKCPQCDTIFSAIAYCPNDGTKLEDYDGDSMPHSLFAEKYEILEEIGKGGMGTVYRVKQVLLDKTLALKVIPSNYLNEQLAVRFQREAKTMASLDHPNLARISDFGIWLNQPFMVMEYVNGSPLSKLISDRVIPAKQAVDLFSQVLDGLAHAHEKGVLHRDIKPSNIMVIDEDGTSKAILLDFGIAKKIETDNGAANTQALTRTGEMIGSPLYMSPEQARGDKLTERSDFYSLGCALFESLTGTPPFVGKTVVETFFLHMEQSPPTLKEATLGQEFAPGLEKLIRKLLAKNPEDRYSSAQELKQALSNCLVQTQPQEKLETIKKKAIPIMPIALVVVGAIAILSTVAFLSHAGDKDALLNTKKLNFTDNSLVNKLPQTLPNELVNGEDQIAVAREENVGSLMKETDPVQSFYKRVLNDRTVAALVDNKRLASLSINHSTFPKSMLAQLPPTLQHLELNGGGLLNDDFKLIAANANLSTLELRFNIVNAKALQHLAGLKHLEMLNLNSTHVEADALKELKPIKSLHSLILSGNETIDDNALRVVSSLNQLQSLDISNTRATAKGISELAKLSNLKTLIAKNLMLHDKDMLAFNQFKTLESLSLTGNPITAEGFKMLPVLKNMKKFDLSECQLNDDVVPYLLRHKNLKILHLSKTKITSAGFLKLAKLPLVGIWSKRTGLSYEEGLEFLRRCPTCQCVDYTNSD